MSGIGENVVSLCDAMKANQRTPRKKDLGILQTFRKVSKHSENFNCLFFTPCSGFKEKTFHYLGLSV